MVYENGTIHVWTSDQYSEETRCCVEQARAKAAQIQRGEVHWDDQRIKVEEMAPAQPAHGARDASAGGSHATFTGEICVYEGGGEELRHLATTWEPTSPVVKLPVACCTPDGVLRCLTEDMAQDDTVALVRKVVECLLAEGIEDVVLTQRRHPMRADDGGTKLAELGKRLGLGGYLIPGE